MEPFYIKKYNSYESGYNMTAGGEGTSNLKGRLHRPHSEETRKKMQQSWTPERRATLAERSKKLVRTQEHKNKISKSLTGRVRSLKHNEAASRSRRGKPATDKQIQALQNRVVSEETRQKMREARRRFLLTNPSK
jgi:hypothetical protein